MQKVNGQAGQTRDRTVLTHRGVEALRPDQTAYRIPDLRCPALALRVAPSGLKTWDVAYRIRGTGAFRRLSLGPFPAIGLEAARERTDALTKAAKGGRDLLAEERAAQVSAEGRTTMGQLLESYLAKRVRGRLRTATEIELRFKRILTPLADQYVEDIRRRNLRVILDKTADRGFMREAEKQRQLLRVLFRWALSQDIIESDPTIGLSSYGSSPRRDRILSAQEIQAFWGWTERSEMPEAYVDALKLQLAIGARIGEIAGMQVEEVNAESWLWTLPPERSKNGLKRVTPIVGLAREILQRRLQMCSQGTLFVAENGKALTTNFVASMLTKRRKKIPIAHFTSHDLRRTVATALVDLGFSFEVVAAVLGHTSGRAEVRTLIRHYVRSDLIERKRQALDAWSAQLREIVGRSDV
jgi:integrase